MTYRIPKPESNRDERFYFIAGFVLVLIVVSIITLFTIAVIKYSDSYNKALNTCIGKGYSRSYCERMMN